MRADLALGLKLRILEQASPATVANVCATSRQNHVQLMPRLYESIEMSHDQDGMERGLNLLRSLCVGIPPRSPHVSAHPATLVRELKLWLSISKSRPELRSTKITALEELVRSALVSTANLQADGQSRLRAFHFYSNAALDLVLLLSLKPQFKDLENLCIVPHDMPLSMRRFGFQSLEIPGLKSLVHREQTAYGYSDERYVDAYIQSLALVPSASPGLTVLHIDFTWSKLELSPAVQSAINALRLPNLQEVQIRAFLGSAEDDPNLRPFLEAHPTLLNVSVPIGNKPLREGALPLLRVFAGHTRDFLQVCDGSRPLRDVTVSLFIYDRDVSAWFPRDPPPYNSENAQAVLKALGEGANILRLALVNEPLQYNRQEVEEDEEDEEDEVPELMRALDVQTIESITTVCPSLTHLELHLKALRDLTTLKQLASLEWVKVHLRMRVPFELFMYDGLEEDSRPVVNIRRAIQQHLIPALPQLREVQTRVVGVLSRRDYDLFDLELSGPGQVPQYDKVYSFDIVRRGPRGAVLSKVVEND